MNLNLPFELFKACHATACKFDTSLTGQALLWEVGVIIITLAVFNLYRKQEKHWVAKLLVTAAGVFIFEFFTHPLWTNEHLGGWAYIYRDVSWILTLAWTVIIISSVMIVRRWKTDWSPVRQYLATLAIVTGFALLNETLFDWFGMRQFSPEALEVIRGHFIPVLHVPWGALYYIPVFMALVVAFVHYWGYSIDHKPVVPLRRRPWIRSLVVALIGVFFYEMMIEPMVLNEKFPAWSYTYRDISFILTTLWVLIIWLASNIVERLLIHQSQWRRYMMTLIISTAFFLPLESWMIEHGYRVYGPSSIANMSGLKIAYTNVPVEVAFAVPFYLALVIAFMKFWNIVIDNRKS